MPTPTNELTLHIAIATIPRRQELEFAKKIKAGFYDTYISNSTKYYKNGTVGNYYKRKSKEDDQESSIEILYNPLKYYIFGTYDIAFISLVDSYKFAQKLFTPKIENDENNASDLLNPHTFQILTGIASTGNGSLNLRSVFYERLKEVNPQVSTFLGICNLKLNNGLLVGNGYFFYDPVLNLIEKTISKILEQNNKRSAPNKDIFLTMQSFSWFEISLILFTEKPDTISKAITELRKLKVSDLKDYDQIIYRTAYFEKDEDIRDQLAKIKDSHIFGDTHSYFGVNYDAFQSPQFMERFPRSNLKLHSETEWQVKPGHLYDLIQTLDKHLKSLNGGKKQKSFDLKTPFLITGKTDYFIANKDTKHFGNVHKLFQIFFNKETSDNIYNYVKKIKTNILLSHEVQPIPGKSNTSKDSNTDFDKYPQQVFRNRLKELAKKPGEINTLNAKLKALKISRQIRSKVSKIFYNYNNGILDSIIFVYFIDFTQFIDELCEYISNVHATWLDSIATETTEINNLSIGQIEESLKIRIKCFEEAYELRMMNCYQYEDISDIDLDFNSSIQQLLTTYSTIASNVSSLFYSDEKPNVPLVLLNENKTESNYFSINYNVYHLLSPEFVFFTIVKESLNEYKFGSGEGTANKLESIKTSLFKSLSEKKILKDLIVTKHIEFDYLYIDAIRFYVTTNLDFELFTYWFWMYNLQNASLYEKVGIINESHFKKELFRLMFLGKLYNFEVLEDECPAPELQNYWDRHYYTLAKVFTELYEKDGDKYLNEQFIKSITELKLAVIDLVNKLNHKQGKKKSGRSNNNSIDNIWLNHFNLTALPVDDYKNSLTKLYEDHIRYPDKGNISFSDPIKYYERFLSMFCFQNGHISALNDGVCIKYDVTDFENPDLFINALMYSYLNYLRSVNKEKVQLLKRNWMDGKPLKCFIETEDEGIYSVDQTGGTFFYSPDRLNSYFKTRNSVLQSLWHFSEIQKKELLESIISIKKKSNAQNGKN